MGTLIVWVLDHPAAAAASRHTVSLPPETASASTAPPGPAASTAVPAGIAGSERHGCPGPLMIAARRPGSSTHAPPGARLPEATTPLAVSAAETGHPVAVSHAAYSRVPPATSTSPGIIRTTRPGTGRLTRCQPLAEWENTAVLAAPHVPAASTSPSVVPNETSVTPTTPHLRPAGEPAIAPAPASVCHVVPALGLARIVPSPSSASSWLPVAARASGVAAR